MIAVEHATSRQHTSLTSFLAPCPDLDRPSKVNLRYPLAENRRAAPVRHRGHQNLSHAMLEATLILRVGSDNVTGRPLGISNAMITGRGDE